MNIQLSPKKIFKALLYGITILILLNFLALTAKFVFHHDTVFGLSKLVSLDLENNIPTWYSALIIFLCSTLLFIIGGFYKRNNGKFHRHWIGLAIVFLFLAVDESASIHELLIVPVRRGLNTTGYFYFAWVVPAMIMLPVLFGVYYKFLLALPKETAALFLTSGSLYVIGALGMEMVGGNIRYVNQETEATRSLVYELVVILEESLEMFGMALFLYALLSFFSKKVGLLKINIEPQRAK